MSRSAICSPRSRGKIGRRYILGGENMSLAEILAEVARVTGRRPPVLRFPHLAVLPLAAGAEAVARLTRREPFATVDGVRMARKKMFFSSARAIEELGYAPRPARYAIADAVAWFKANGYLAMSTAASDPSVAVDTVEAPSGKGRGDENFPVGSWLIRRDLRVHVHAFYRFARNADDIADSPVLSADEKIRRLDRMAAILDGDPGGRPAPIRRPLPRCAPASPRPGSRRSIAMTCCARSARTR